MNRITVGDVSDRIRRVLPAMDDLRARIAKRAGGEIEESVPLIRPARARGRWSWRPGAQCGR